ncbi:zeta toxin family protein [Pseudomonas sp. ANT_H12B]|uniref:zeta toxin family protein n=1 Tax=Pseudomonas sp. ANT_H12B TaxID=2597348 RepID=UPI0011EF372C|nr:zeta toxin family protein [Pseudomonas sp. ANT_H12B]KAA0963084.1 Zeta toxin [Pseudomonas sp. ANT_H12B]
MESALLFAKANKKRIAKEFTNPAVYLSEQSPVSVFMSGCAGAGKTEAAIELIDELVANTGVRTMRIDPDDLRNHFEGYIGTNSWMYQRAASILVDKIHDMALDQSQSFVLDGTLCNLEKADLNITRSLRKSRQCVIMFVYQKPELAWRFVQARERQEGRRIPPEIFVEQFFLAKDVVNALKDKFGNRLLVNLLIKNTDASLKSYKEDIHLIEDGLHDGYDRQSLLRYIKAGERL